VSRSHAHSLFYGATTVICADYKSHTYRYKTRYSAG